MRFYYIFDAFMKNVQNIKHLGLLHLYTFYKIDL